MKKSLLTIGMVAQAAKVNIQTIRYYERRKILRPVARNSSGYRLYDEKAVGTLRFIRRAQNLGFSLRDISSLLLLRSSNGSSSKVSKVATQKIDQIDEKLAKLKDLEGVLKGIVQDCQQKKTSEGSPVLNRLNKTLWR